MLRRHLQTHSFGKSNDELDSMSLATSECGDWANSGNDSALPPPDGDSVPRGDSELMQVLTKDVQELGLDWSPPEEPTHS